MSQSKQTSRPKRKIVQTMVAVTVPADMIATDVRKELRSLINDQCNYSADEGDIKVKKIGPVRYFKNTELD